MTPPLPHRPHFDLPPSKILWISRKVCLLPVSRDHSHHSPGSQPVSAALETAVHSSGHCHPCITSSPPCCKTPIEQEEACFGVSLGNGETDMLQQDTAPGKVPRLRVTAGLTHLLVTITDSHSPKLLFLAFRMLSPFLFPIPSFPASPGQISPPQLQFLLLSLQIIYLTLACLSHQGTAMHVGISEAKLHVLIGSSNSSYPCCEVNKSNIQGH